MILFFYETPFSIENELNWKNWLNAAVETEGFQTEEINYIFCDDEYLLDINIQYLDHDYYTDVIGFQYSEGKEISGDVYISVDRVRENAENHQKSFENELARVMIHGILHFMNYKDKTEEEAKKMKEAEERHLSFLEEII
ncbi:rRNA maturation RNase YbeY [Moheibacter lacus]|uniref:Endoribonuclease YbeY n=1 Tax=Moheibacter lacus TaxID=2745851 RepID=A0A838ZMJ9_9FLAO|nr:rRNA maturation RNase YbeY [Moheibacter lacus]MBA5629030.1 rRNA maturation RNase YbeY [Moheibacter lacus]